MRFYRDPPKIIPAGSTKTLSRAVDRGAVVRLDTITGSVVTLPPSLGDGCRFLFLVSALATSNAHIIKVANATDVMRGIIACLDSDLATVNNFGFAAGSTADTITLDRTNTGSVTLGEWIEVFDYAAGFWHVRGQLSGAAPATPFSATVS